MILCCVSADVFIEVLCYMFTPWTLLVFHSHFAKIPQALTFAVFFNLAQPQKEAEDVSANTAHNAVEPLKLQNQLPTPDAHDDQGSTESWEPPREWRRNALTTGRNLT